MMQRREVKARLYDGFSWTVSARALISRLPMDPTWDDTGMRMELVR